MSSVAPTPAAAAALPRCPYGTGCYRTNPMHKRDFDHSMPPVAVAAAPAPATKNDDSDGDSDDSDADTPGPSSRSRRSATKAAAAASSSSDSPPGRPDPIRAPSSSRASRAAAAAAPADAGDLKKGSKAAAATSTPKGSVKKKAPRSPAASPARRAIAPRASRAAAAAAAAPVVAAPGLAVVPVPAAAVAAAAVAAPPVAPPKPSRVSRFAAYFRFESEAALRASLGPQLCRFLLLALLSVLMTTLSLQATSAWLASCEGDHVFACATGSGGRFVPSHEYGGSCAVFTDLLRWRDKACRELWWVDSLHGEVHPGLSCRDLCNSNAASIRFMPAIILALALCWTLDAFTAWLPRPPHSCSTAPLQWAGVARRVALAVLDGQAIARAGMVPQYADGGLFLAGVLLGLHAIIAGSLAIGVAQFAPPAPRSSYSRRWAARRPSPPPETMLEGVELGALAFALVGLGVGCLLSWGDGVHSDVGVYRSLEHGFSDWKVGGVSWAYAALALQTAVMALHGREQWRERKRIQDAIAAAEEEED